MGCSNGKVQTVNGSIVSNYKPPENQDGNKPSANNNDYDTIADADKDQISNQVAPNDDHTFNEDKPIVEDVSDDDNPVNNIPSTILAEDSMKKLPKETDSTTLSEEKNISATKDTFSDSAKTDENTLESINTESNVIDQSIRDENKAEVTETDKDAGEEDAKRDPEEGIKCSENNPSILMEASEGNKEDSKDEDNQTDRSQSPNIVQSSEKPPELENSERHSLKSVPEVDETQRKSDTASPVVRDE